MLPIDFIKFRQVERGIYIEEIFFESSNEIPVYDSITLKIMAINSTVYRMQLFAFSIISSMLVFQYSIIMSDHGVPTAVSLTVYSISQIIIFLATVSWGKIITKVDNKNRVIQATLLFRILIVSLLIFASNEIFVLLYLLYHMVSSSIDIAFEGLVGRWAFSNDKDFGKIRLFGSIGYSISGLVASILFTFTFNTDILLVFILIANITGLLGTVLSPISVKQEADQDRKKIKFSWKTLSLIAMCALIASLPNTFGVILNEHYMTEFHLVLEQAVFFAGISLFLGSCISEVTSFYYVDRLIRKYKPENIVFLGIMFSLIRWCIAFIAGGPIMFTLTYLFHGLAFSFVYLGCISYAKAEYGEEAVSESVVKFSVFASIISFVLTAIFPIILGVYTTSFIIGMFIVISLGCLIFCKIYYRK